MRTTFIETQDEYGLRRHRLLIQPDSRYLAVILPGSGYSAERPLLHYSVSLALEQGCDVLTIDYGPGEHGNHDFVSILEAAAEAIRQAEQPYHRQIILIGKSYGTLVAGKLTNRIRRPYLLVFFTPVRSTLSFMNGDRFIAFSGTEDPLLSMDEIRRWFNGSHPGYYLYPGANHSLEIPDNTWDSLDILHDVLGKMEDFCFPR